MSIFVDISQFVLQTAPLVYYITVLLGAAVLLSNGFRMVLGLFKIFRKRLDFKERYGEKSWALVTGGSEGIGRQLASELAKQGVNIVLLARTQSKLKNTQKQIKNKYPSVEVEYVVADLAAQGQKEDINQVLPQLSKYDFSIVVNNAGVDVLNYYQNLKVSEIINLININCFSLCALTYKFARIFKEKVKKTGKKCAIINVGSLVSQIPIPLFHVYTGSKAYVNKLTQNLVYELPEIDWLLLNPSEVSTFMTCFKNLDLFTITAEQCAKSTIDGLGRDTFTNGHISHKIQGFIYSLLSYEFFSFVWMKLFAPHWMAERKKFAETRKGLKE